MAEKTFKILFVCKGNIFRSASAELILKRLLRERGVRRVAVSSAGIVADPEPMNPATRATLRELHIPVRNFRQRRLTRTILRGKDVVVAMGVNHRNILRRKFGVAAVLFNELAAGVKTSVPDVEDKVRNFRIHPEATARHIRKVVRYLHRRMPRLLEHVMRREEGRYSRAVPRGKRTR